MIRRRKRRRHRAKPEPRIVVKPSEELEARISREVAKATAILMAPTIFNLLDSPYLVSAIYYHDGLLDGFPINKPTADPTGRIVGHVVNRFASDTKIRLVALLQQLCALESSELTPYAFAPPVPWGYLGSNRTRRAHSSAIDLFVEEGTPVLSVTRGLVVLAESGYRDKDWLSTSSLRGGNSIIVFDPDQVRFCRYAHLEAITVCNGEFVDAGYRIGSVGHSGFNAQRKGHGRHLHFEINEFVAGTTRAVPNEDLEDLLVSSRALAQPPAVSLPIISEI